jgi:nucleoside-diphosphate-sugar epimerase
MKQYLVTGGAGFIGSHIVQALLEKNAVVRVLDNFSSGKHQNIDVLMKSKTAGRLEVYEGDIRDPVKVAEVVAGVDAIFHAAAFVSVPESMDKPQECFDVNITGTTVLFEAARKAGVRRVVIASSAAVYGDADVMPIVEDIELRPMSPYAVSKRITEMLGELYTRSFGLEVVSLRYFNVYGPRQQPDSMYAAAIPIFLGRMMNDNSATVFGDGTQTRDFVFIDDVVRANLIAAEQPAAAGHSFNVCSGCEISVLDLLKVIHELFPNAPESVFSTRRVGDIYKSIGSPEFSKRILGFDAQIDLAAGLKKTSEWMLSHNNNL